MINFIVQIKAKKRFFELQETKTAPVRLTGAANFTCKTG